MHSLWYKIRKEAGLKQADVARKFKVSRQYINRIEMGVIKAPIKYQIYYLKLRNCENDKMIINFLEEITKEEGVKNGR